MNQLSTDQQDALRKTNTEHLRIMAAKTGTVDNDELETMDRTALLELVAQDIVAKKGADKGMVGRRQSERSDRSDRVREMELQVELKSMEMEMESKKNENKRMEMESKKAESRQREIEAERERE